MNGDRPSRPPVTDQQLVSAVGRAMADRGHVVSSVDIDRELTAGANRRTVRLVIGRPEADSIGAIAQIVTRDADRPSHTRSVIAEGAVIEVAGRHGVPVANVLAADESPELGDAELLVTAEVLGETIPRRVLRRLAELPEGGRSLTHECGRALAKLHTVYPADPTLSDDLLPTRPATAYVDYLTERLDDLPDRHPAFRLAIELLRNVPPSPPPTECLIHGDFRIGNLIVASPPSADVVVLAAVLDWELAHIGDPMEDLAWLCLRTWRFGADHNEVGGFGSLDDLRRAYTGAGGEWRQEGFQWWTIARTVWWGIGLAAQAAAFADGRSRSLVHAASGRRVVELEYDLLRLLAPLVE